MPLDPRELLPSVFVVDGAGLSVDGVGLSDEGAGLSDEEAGLSDEDVDELDELEDFSASRAFLRDSDG